MKYWLAFSIGISIVLSALAAITIGIMADGWQKSANSMWEFSASQVDENIENRIRNMVDFLKFAASSVPYFTPELYSQSMPTSGFDPTILIRMYKDFDTKSGFEFNSFGFLRRITGSLTAKESYQVAKFYICPVVIWAYSDPSINPGFVGYCVDNNGQFNKSAADYNGVDWGLKQLEMDILDGKVKSSFLPLFNLLGNFTLTFEMGYPETGPTYAVTFAEMDVTQLSTYVSNLWLMQGKGIVNIFETQTSLMIASTIPGAVVAKNGTRLPVGTISTEYIVQNKRFIDSGINWTIQIAIKQSDIYGNMRYFLGVSIGVSVAVLVVFVVLIFIAMRYWISNPMNDILRKLRGEKVTPSYNRFVGDDILPIQEHVFKGDLE